MKKVRWHYREHLFVMTRAKQEAKGWNNVDLCDLAAAHAAYFIATGKDLFARNVVRARGGALYFDANGLRVLDFNDDSRDYRVAASAALPSRNFCLLFFYIFIWS